MFLILVALLTIGSAWKWGDWKNWKRYLPTIQYFIMGDLLYNLFCQDYLLWSYPHPPNVFPNHIFTNLFIMFTLYPSTMLIFLYRVPRRNVLKQTLYILFWIVLWLIFELIMITSGLCVYHHGWTYFSSTCFVIVMVLMLVLHFKRPGLVYLLSVPIVIALLLYFHVPVF